jgi:hypothetical protein
VPPASVGLGAETPDGAKTYAFASDRSAIVIGVRRVAPGAIFLVSTGNIWRDGSR